MRFAGLSFDEKVPNHTRICRFRKELKELGFFDHLLATFNELLEAQGYIVEGDTIVDAKIIRNVIQALLSKELNYRSAY